MKSKLSKAGAMKIVAKQAEIAKKEHLRERLFRNGVIPANTEAAASLDPIEQLFTGVAFRGPAAKFEAVARVREFFATEEKEIYARVSERNEQWMENKNAELREAHAVIQQLCDSIDHIKANHAKEIIKAACRDFGQVRTEGLEARRLVHRG